MRRDVVQLVSLLHWSQCFGYHFTALTVSVSNRKANWPTKTFSVFLQTFCVAVLCRPAVVKKASYTKAETSGSVSSSRTSS